MCSGRSSRSNATPACASTTSTPPSNTSASNCDSPQEQQRLILGHFIDGGDRTSGGVLHAVTSTAQTLPDPDDAYDLERAGLRAMAVAAAYQR
jgi:hypothetical protein